MGAGGYRIQVMASSRGYSSEQEFKDDMGNSTKGDKVLCKGFAARSMKGELSIIPQKVSSSILEICMLKKILFIQIEQLKQSTLRKGNPMCRPCGISSKNQGHWQSTQHKENLIRCKFKDKLEIMTPKAMGLNVELKIENSMIDIHDDGNVIVNFSSGTATVFDLEITPQSESQIDLELIEDIYVPKNDVISYTSFECQPKDPASINITVKCDIEQVGQYKVPLVLILKKQRVVIEITVNVTSSLIRAMGPKETFSKHRETRCFKGNREGMLLPKQKLLSSKELELCIPLNYTPIDENRRKLIKCGFDETKVSTADELNQLQDDRQTLTAKLEPKNYKQKMALMIECEQVANETEMEAHDLIDVKITKITEEIFMIEGSQIPCRVGDMVYLSKTGTEWRVMYRAWVNQVIM